MKLALLLLSLYAAFAFGHGGGLNGQGGHFNRATGYFRKSHIANDCYS